MSSTEVSGSVVSEQQTSILTGLEPWSNYSISVAASTKAGEGVTSSPTVCTTDEDGEFNVKT